jgi:hypothetical protein
MACGCWCGPAQLREDFDYKTEETEGGVQITITAKDPEKAEALKKLLEAQRVLCGDKGCC